MKTPLLFAALALASLSLAPLAACASGAKADAPAAQAGTVAFESITSGPSSGLTQAERSVIRTGPAWEAAWKRINSYRLPAPPLPSIDFEREMVVLVALGQRPTAGHAVEVVQVRREGGFLRVRALASSPPPDTYQAQVITYPFHAVRVARHDGPVEVVVE